MEHVLSNPDLSTLLSEKNIEQAIKEKISLKEFPEELRSKKAIVLEVLKYAPMDLEFAPDFQDCKEVVLVAVNGDGAALKFASSRLQDDEEIVLPALSRTAFTLNFASIRLQKEKKIWFAALKSSCNLKILRDIQLQDDEEFIELAIESSIRILAYASDRLKNTRRIVLKAVENAGMELRHAPTMQDDEEIVFSAVKNNVGALLYASDRLKGNRKIILMAIQKGAYFLPMDLDNNFFSDLLKNDLEVALAFFLSNTDLFKKHNYPHQSALKVISENKELMLLAIEKDKKCIPFISPDLMKRENEIVFSVLKHKPSLIWTLFELFSPQQKNDFNFCHTLVKIDGLILSMLPIEFRDNQEIVLSAVNENAFALFYASDAKKEDPEIVLRAVNNNPAAIICAAPSFRKDSALFDSELVNEAKPYLLSLKDMEYSHPDINSFKLFVSINELFSLVEKRALQIEPKTLKKMITMDDPNALIKLLKHLDAMELLTQETFNEIGSLSTKQRNTLLSPAILTNQNLLEEYLSLVKNKKNLEQAVEVRKISRKQSQIARSELSFFTGQKRITVFVEHKEQKNYLQGGEYTVKKCYADASSHTPLYLLKKRHRSRYENQNITETVYSRLVDREAFYFRHNNKDFLFTKWIEGENLASYKTEQLREHPLSDRIKSLNIFFSELALFHEQNLVHGDIKPGNCVLNLALNELHVIDLGSTRTYLNSEEHSRTTCYLEPKARYFFQGRGYYFFYHDIFSSRYVVASLFPELFVKFTDKVNADECAIVLTLNYSKDSILFHALDLLMRSISNKEYGKRPTAKAISSFLESINSKMNLGSLIQSAEKTLNINYFELYPNSDCTLLDVPTQQSENSSSLRPY